MKNFVLLSIVALLSVNPVLAKKGGIFKELNLSSEQKEKLKAHRKENKGSMKPLREEMRSLRGQMNDAFTNGASDSELKGIDNKIASLRSQMREKKLAKMIFLKNLLTPEQRKMFLEKKKSRRQGRKGKRGN